MKKIGKYLLEMGGVREDALNRALETQKTSGELIGTILRSEGVVSEASLQLAYAMQQRDNDSERGLGSAMAHSLAIFRRYPIAPGDLILCLLTGLISGLFSFPIIFYFYSGWAWEIIGISRNVPNMAWISAGAMCLILLSVALEAFAAFLCIRVTRTLLRSVSLGLHQKIIARAIHRIDVESNNSIMSIYSQNIEQFATQFESFLSKFPKTISGLLTFFLIVSATNPGLATLTLALASITIIVPPLLAARAQPFLNKETGLMGAAMNNIEPFFYHFRTAGGVLLSRTSEQIEAFLKPHHLNQASKWFYWTTSFNLRSLLNFLTLTTLLIYGGISTLNGTMPLAKLFSLYIAVTLMLPYFNGLYDSYFQIVTAGYHAEIIEKQLSIAEITAEQNLVVETPLSLFVSIDHFRFGEKTILQDFNREFLPGRLYLVKGKSGSGKSTLAQIIAGLILCERSSVIISTKQGDTVRTLGSVAYIGAEPIFLENLSVAKNIARDVEPSLATEQIIQERISKFQVDLSRYASNPAFSLNNELSGGEKQRLHLLRGLHMRQKIKIFDEPTGSLDHATAEFIKLELRKVPVDEIRIVITHDQAWEVEPANSIELRII